MINTNYSLRTILWETTLRCNANCSFCGSRCSANNIQSELSTEEIINVFRRLSLQMNAHNVMINVTGGEPLVRNDTIEIMKTVHSFGFPWGLVTNGTLLSEKVV